MDTGYDLRKARIDDLPALRGLHRLSLAAFGAPHYTRAELAGFFADLEMVAPEIIRDGTYYVVTHQGRVVASGGWTLKQSTLGPQSRREAGPRATIHGVFVHPDHAGRNLGRTILDVAEAEAVIRGRAYRMELCATLADAGFYRRRGYLPGPAVHLGLSNGTNFELLRMEKRILADRLSRVTRRPDLPAREAYRLTETVAA